MASDNESYFGRCRCCLNHGYLKHMWTQYGTDPNTEVFGQILVDCFALSWVTSEDTMSEDHICDACIKRLREANSFKQMVLDSQNQLFSEDGEIQVKMERVEEDDDASEHSGEEIFMVYDGDTEYQLRKGSLLNDVDESMHSDTESQNIDGDETVEEKKDIDYQEVEYLEDVDVAVPESINKEASSAMPKKKWPKKLPKADRYKTYKQYPIEDLKKALDKINEGMSVREAAELYKIPKKTLSGKLRNNDFEDAPDKIKMLKFIKDIKSILTYTNATPFKVKTTRNYCAYCGTDYQYYEDAEDLRAHTRTEHASDRIQKAEFMMKPYFFNEILRFDIDNLMCTVCCTPISSWNSVFEHLREKHNTVLEQGCTRAIPYVLADKPNCALCDETFTSFMHVDVHMNAHYTNYMCGECGDTYLTSSRLKCHERTHERGRFPCSYCKKIFYMEKYKRKHEDIVHHKVRKLKCHYCELKFVGDYDRHNHMLKEHSDKIKTFDCELCGKHFDMKAKYTCHMSKVHGLSTKAMKCGVCGQTFDQMKQFEKHKLLHLNQENYCEICNKKYVGHGAFKTHMKRHETIALINSV